jgi:hypothetical protein
MPVAFLESSDVYFDWYWISFSRDLIETVGVEWAVHVWLKREWFKVLDPFVYSCHCHFGYSPSNPPSQNKTLAFQSKYWSMCYEKYIFVNYSRNKILETAKEDFCSAQLFKFKVMIHIGRQLPNHMDHFLLYCLSSSNNKVPWPISWEKT